MPASGSAASGRSGRPNRSEACLSIQAPPGTKPRYDQFLSDSLPQLLAERLPLADYQVTEAGPHACSIHIALNGGVQTVFTPLPRPDEDGLFYLADEPCVVIPTASQEELDIAEIACVGEQLLAFIQERLGQASNGITWNEEVLRAWLPLDRWIDEFLQAKAQRLDTTNWLSRHTHLRRIIIPDATESDRRGPVWACLPLRNARKRQHR